LQDSYIKFLNYDFEFIIDTKINLSNSKLYFFSYQNQIIFVVYFTDYLSLNLIKMNFIDYSDLYLDLELNFENEYLEQINKFIDKLIIHSKNIINIKNILDKNFTINKIYPTISKIYLKSLFFNKYCVILIKNNYFMVTFNDEKENYFRVDNLEKLLNH
jgi:hypothetical protein